MYFPPFNSVAMKTLLGSCVGIDVSKDGLQVCLSVIDTDQHVRVKSTTGFANQPSGFQALFKWAAKHCPAHLPLVYVMESTGVYHQQLA
jgi:transposase